MARAAAMALGLLAACDPRAPRLELEAEAVAVRAAQAERELRRLGAGLFEVERFVARSEEVVAFDPGELYSRWDTIERRATFYRLEVEARVRLLADYQPLEDPRARAQSPGVGYPELADGLAVRSVLGRRPLGAGEVVEARTQAVFDVLDPGWSLRTFDDQRPWELRVVIEARPVETRQP